MYRHEDTPFALEFTPVIDVMEFTWLDLAFGVFGLGVWAANRTPGLAWWSFGTGPHVAGLPSLVQLRNVLLHAWS